MAINTIKSSLKLNTTYNIRSRSALNLFVSGRTDGQTNRRLNVFNILLALIDALDLPADSPTDSLNNLLAIKSVGNYILKCLSPDFEVLK